VIHVKDRVPLHSILQQLNLSIVSVLAKINVVLTLTESVSLFFCVFGGLLFSLATTEKDVFFEKRKVKKKKIEKEERRNSL
jgi:hypothetical protein